MENDRNEMIDKFCCITNVSEEVAKDCLECCGWKLSIAIEKFLANNDADDVEGWANDNSNGEDDPQTAGPKLKSEPEVERKQSKPKKKSGRENKVSSSSSSSSSANRIHTIHTIQNSDEDSDGSEDDDGQAFYAGGSERSGQQIIGPHKNKDMIKDMFKTLKENGGQVVEPDDSSSSMARNPRQQKTTTRAFQGTGFKLGQSLDDSETVPGTSTSAQNQRESAEASTSSTDDSNSCVVLRMWRNGFTIDDGPLRLYDDPENRNFLISIRRGETPLELLKNARNREVHVNMEDHHYKDYEPPTNRTVRAFGGQGYVLGNMVPNCTENVSTTPTPSTSASTSTTATPVATSASIEIRQIEIDGNLPSTNIQIRLRDGSRLNGRFNLTNTVADIKRFILMNKPEYGAYDFNLIIPFPRTKLDDQSKTIQEANLMNTTLTQDIQ